MNFFKDHWLGIFVSSVGASLVASFIYAWLTAGWIDVVGAALATLLSVVAGICGFAYSLIYRRYISVLGAGAKPKGSLERQAYDRLRKSLVEGGSVARVYGQRLTRFLDAVDHFFGDAGTTDRTLFPHAFGLRTPAPLWTAPAFDQCLLLALIYPIGTIFIIWAVSGHVGPAEAALHLDPDLPGWQRGLAAALVGFSIFAFWCAKRTQRGKFFAWIAVATAGAAAVTGVGVGVSVVVVAAGAAVLAANNDSCGAVCCLSICGVVFAAVFGNYESVVFSCAGVLGVTLAGSAVVRRHEAGKRDVIILMFGAAIGFVLIILTLGIVGAIFGFISGSGSVTGAYAVIGTYSMVILSIIPVFCIDASSVDHRWHGVFLALLLAAMILACLSAANLLAPLESWERVGPMLLFLGFFTLLNAPFDWVSLGLTRALLRRGLELAGWWPYLLALADALFATIIIAVLAVAMVIGVQAYDGLALHGGGAPVLPLDPIFNGIAAYPAAPEYWWIYALLLSTMIPSLINLVIGGASLVRGLPGLPCLLLRKMPVGKAVPTFERNWMALVLTGQWFVGAALGIAAQLFLGWFVIGYAMPWFGLGLLGVARTVAAFDLPMRTWQLFGDIL